MAFVFRAAAALDIRRRQEDAARQALAAAETAVNEAATRVGEAAAAVAADGDRMIALQRSGSEAFRIEWHQAWIERQRRVVVQQTTALEQRRREAAAAAQAAIEAAKRRKVLDRLRERAWRRHQQTEQDEHIRDMNDLATQRFVAQVTTEGETRAD